MAEPTEEHIITDEDILEDVNHLILDTFGVRMSREFFRVRVVDGVIIFSGNVSSVVGHEMLIDNARMIDGVMAIDDENLYNDEDLRMKLTKVLPRGMRVHVHHGAVRIAGRLPADTDLNEIIGRIGETHGVTIVDASAVRQ